MVKISRNHKKNRYRLFRRFLGAFVLGAGLVIIFALKPAHVINNHTIKFLPYIASLYDITLAWQMPKIDWQQLSRSRHQAILSMDQICLEQERFSFCSDKAKIRFFIDLYNIKDPLEALIDVDIEGIKLALKPSAHKSQDSSEIPINHIYSYEEYLRAITNLKIESLRLNISEIMVSSTQAVELMISGSIDLKKHASLPVLVGSVSLDDSVRGDYLRVDFQNEKISGLDRVLSNLRLKHKNFFVTGSYLINQPKQEILGLEIAKMDIDSDFFNFSLNGRLDIRPKKITADVSALIRSDQQSSFSFFLDSCHYEGWWGELRNLSGVLTCELQGLINPPGKTPRSLLSFETRLHYNLSPERYKIEMINSVTKGATREAIFIFDGSIYSKLEGIYLNRWPRLISSLDLSVKLSQYADLVSKLKGTQFAIPSPLNDLDGTLSCKLVGDYDNTALSSVLPIMCDIDLRSDLQKITGDIDAGLEISESEHRSYALNGRVNLGNSQVYLPDIDIGASLPGFFSDPRIVRENSDQSKSLGKIKGILASDFSNSFSYDIALKTKPSSYLYVYHKSLKTPLPLIIDLSFSSQKALVGQLSLKDYAASLFRRQVMVRNLNLRFNGLIEQKRLSGLLEFEQADAFIKMHLSGSLHRPNIIFESEPPVPDSEIYAGLLFGGSTDTLSTNSLRSIEEARAAFTDGAISLLSMYYLASTPIESIGYNPSNRHFVARVRMPNGLMLSLGQSQQERAEVVLKKRIGRNWTIETRATKDQATGENRGQALLRWGRRY